MPLDPATLSARDRALLAPFLSHPALTPDGWQRLVRPGDSLNALMKVARRLGYRGWIEIHRLPDESVCYMLSRRGAVALGLPQPKRRGLGHDAAIEHLGTLWLCLRCGIAKRSAAQVRAHCPEFCRRGLAANGYGVGPDDRLLWLVIDHGARPARIARKAARAVVLRERVQEFRDLIDAGGFGVVVAVPTPSKAAGVEAALAGLPINRRVAVRVEVVPELVSLSLK